MRQAAFRHLVLPSLVMILLGGVRLQSLEASSASATPASRVAQARLPTAQELLASMDKVMQFDTRTATSIMQVIDARQTREYKMVSYGRGLEDSAIEYLLPEREKGTRMLKKGQNLWIYMPRAERVQKISGHMLRQGMMGSDISYEDMMQSSEFEKLYDAKVLGEEQLGGRDAYKLEALARDQTVSYPKRVIWVDKATRIPVKQELFALSGMLLKTWIMSDIKQIEGRNVATRMELTDQLKKGSKTVILTESVSFGVKLQEEVFTMRWLERK